MTDAITVAVGQRVKLAAKDVLGTVAFVGPTQFAQGKWVGVILDEAKGRNNGSVDGVAYFNCGENRGVFVRSTQLLLVDQAADGGSTMRTFKESPSAPPPVSAIKSSSTTPTTQPAATSPGDDVPKKEIKKPQSRLPLFGAGAGVSGSRPCPTAAPATMTSVSPVPLELVQTESEPLPLPPPDVTDSPPTSVATAAVTKEKPTMQKRTLVPPKSFIAKRELPTPKRKSMSTSSLSNSESEKVPGKSGTERQRTFTVTPTLVKTPNFSSTPAAAKQKSLATAASSSKRTSRISELITKTPSALSFRTASTASASTSSRPSSATPSTASTASSRSSSTKSVPADLSQTKVLEPKKRLSSTSSITTSAIPNTTGRKSIGSRGGLISPRPKSGPTASSRLSLPRHSIASAYTPKRLPVAGSKDNKSLQSTPSGSRTNLSTSMTTTSGTTNKVEFNVSTKKSSFVDTIAESIVPQYTPGTPVSALTTPITTPMGMMMGSEDRFNTMQTIETLRSEVRDLTEKLEILKGKRGADQDKLREMERLRLEVEKLTENKSRLLESQAALQRDLMKARQEAREAVEAKELHAEEMSELSEAVEMATLDKEMAEEKAETLQLELEQANDRVSQLSTELGAIKEEFSGPINPNSTEANSIQVKQMQAENNRLKEALIKFRDASAQEKHLHQKIVKDAETHKAEVVELARTKERLESRCVELEAQITDLQERHDAALGSEEMVENLTEKNLNLEEKVNQLAEAVADLEALQDINDQLQESAKESEMELREELQQSVQACHRVLREREAIMETLADREAIILRFREQAQKLRDDNDMLRKNLEEESSKSLPGLPEALDFKKIFAESKAQTTAIDLELRRLEAKEATLHVQYLSAFMPDGFIKRGGDNDAVLVLLLIPRVVGKVELLLGQVKEKLVPAAFVDVTSFGEDLLVSQDVERYAFACQFSFLLYALLNELHRWTTALNACSTEDFLKAGNLFQDLSIQEKVVDSYLELLRKSQLDENISLDGMEKCITSFQNFYVIHLAEEQVEPAVLVSDLCLASAAASDCVIVAVNRLIHMLKKSEKTSNMGALLQDLKTIGESLRQLSKRTRRYLPDPPKQPPVTNKLQSQLLNDSVTLRKVVKILQEACKQALRNHGMVSGNEGIPSSKVEEYLYSAVEKCDSRVEGSGGVKEVIKEWLTTSLMTMTDLAQVVSEAPVYPKDKPPTPLSLRSQAVKAELDQTRNLRIQLEDKEAGIKELKKILMAKKDELSEATIRKELAEKKLSNASKDSEMTIEKLTRKLEDVQSMLQRKEREFQATVEHFQSDIESLESERGELKVKLMNSAKMKFLEGIARSASVTPLQSPGHEGYSSVHTSQLVSPSGFIPAGSSGIPSSSLAEYTRFLQRQNWRLKSMQVANNMKKLKPLQLPKKEDREAVKQLETEYWKLKRAWNTLMCESLRIALRNDVQPARKQYLLFLNSTRKAELVERIAELKERMKITCAEMGIGCAIKADFTVFPLERTKKEAESEAVKVATLRLPGWEKNPEKPRQILLTQEQFHEIHRLLDPI